MELKWEPLELICEECKGSVSFACVNGEENINKYPRADYVAQCSTESCIHNDIFPYCSPEPPNWCIRDIKQPRNKNPDFVQIFAILYPDLKRVANDHGYCLSLHGSMVTDFDLVLTAWCEDAKPTIDVLNAIKEVIHYQAGLGMGEIKPHGRIAWVVPFASSWLDISVPNPIGNVGLTYVGE